MPIDSRRSHSPAPLILASGSPRRRELLAHLGVSFDVRPSNAPEIPAPGETPSAFAPRVAADKARDVARQYPDRLVLGADTIVVKDGVIFGKPSDRHDARRMLTALSGAVHEVMTGVALVVPAALTPVSSPSPQSVGAAQPGEGEVDADASATVADSGPLIRSVLAVSRVEFRALSAAQIEAYLDTDEPWDKAGAYALQGRAGAFVATVDGSRSNIIGLPLGELAALLAPFLNVREAPEELR